MKTAMKMTHEQFDSLAARLERLEAKHRLRFALHIALASIILAGPCPSKTPSRPNPNIVVQVGHSGFVSSVAFSPDDRLLVSGSDDNTLKLWRPATGELLRTLEGHRGSVLSVSFSPDGRSIASGSMDNTVKLWSVHTGACLHTLEGHTKQVMSVAFSPGGKLLASGSWDGTVRIWNPSSGRLLRTLRGAPDGVNAVAFSPDGRSVAAGTIQDANPLIILWDATTGKQLRKMAPPMNQRMSYSDTNSLAFSPDGTRVACGCGQGIELWDPKSGTLLQTLTRGDTAVECVAWSRDGRTLAGASGKLVDLWDVRSGQLLRTLSGHHALVTAVMLSHRGDLLASGSQDASIRLWDWRRGHLRRAIARNHEVLVNVGFSPDGKILGVSDGMGHILLWPLFRARGASAFLPQRLNLGKRVCRQFVFSPDNHLLAANLDSTAQIWELRTRRLKAIIKSPGRLIGSMAFSRDGRTLAIGAEETPVKLWNPRTGKIVRVLDSAKAPNETSSLAFLPDAARLAVAGQHPGAGDRLVSELVIWDLRSGQASRSVRLPLEDEFNIAVNRKGTLVAAVGDRGLHGVVAIWNRATRLIQPVHMFDDGPGFAIAFSPDGRWLVNTTGDGYIQFRDASAGELKHALRAHDDAVSSIAFSRSGRLLSSSDMGGEVRIWSATHRHLLATMLILAGSADRSRSARDDWIIFTPAGFYDSTPGAERWIRWREGETLYPASWGRGRFRRPDLVRKSIDGYGT